MIQLIINGTPADLLEGGFKTTLQVNDMHDAKTRQLVISDTIKLPTTATNHNIFGFAGMKGIKSSSHQTHRTYSVDYYIDGYQITQNAIGHLLAKDEYYYHFYFIDRSKDLYNVIMGLKVKDLNLKSLNYQTTATKIQEMHRADHPDIIPLVADYGGETIKEGGFNFDYTTPSIRMDWILRQMEQLGGFRFQGAFFESDFWKNLYMTTANVKKVEGDKPTEFDENFKFTAVSSNNKKLYFTPNGKLSETPVPIYKARGKGKYKVYFDVENTSSDWEYFDFTFFSNDTNKQPISAWAYAEWDDFYNDTRFFDARQRGSIDLEEGEEVFLTVSSNANEDAAISGNILLQLSFDGYINVEELFSDFSLYEWFRQVLFMFNLTQIKDPHDEKTYHFLTLEERINYEALDWSEKLIKEDLILFHTEAFARYNYFTYKKYDEQSNEQDKSDGLLALSDEALKDTKKFESLFFAGKPNSFSVKEKWQGVDEFEFLDTFEFWVKEVKDNGGVQYKEKANRCHLMLCENVKDKDHQYRVNGNTYFNMYDYKIGRFTELQWNELLKKYWNSAVFSLFDTTEEYRFKMKLSPADVANFDFRKTLYLAQYGAYFLINKIDYVKGGVSTVEAYKIKK